MRVISLKPLHDFCRLHPDAAQAAMAWADETSKASWRTPQDIKDQYRTSSFVRSNRVIFNIKGNEYRLVVAVAYRFGAVYVKFIGTHQEYDAIDAATVELP
ncbi:type II toxin-antitoxin system HigB family toxin [Ramlibacter albus]|uniref:Type II toxin-antitoxin system HigB family toxin n=1 Tax=Ramlibacter albus TaxID=2079448 RepID=A0A923MBR3_9BURK|nr:type II toxin-antitoxin system HigB family toxin [Ramlibacter albus]MBC5766464.1 type II toxin-antitoxin system HigB family toxin [Ramlibacter albus]